MLLNNHNQSYTITYTDAAISLATGFSGIPYSLRHWQLASSSTCLGALGHHLIAVIELCPVLGGMTAVTEKIISVAYSSLLNFSTFEVSIEDPSLGDEDRLLEALRVNSEVVLEAPVEVNPTISWRKTAISVDEAFDKMIRNTQKALEEHRTKKGGEFLEVFADYKDIEPFIVQKVSPSEPPLNIVESHYDAQGRRRTMEDYTFYYESQESALVGVLDGHGGSDVSEKIGSDFSRRFFEVLKDLKGNVHQAFEVVFDEFNQEILSSASFNNQGSTAVICFIDKASHLIYTATLGDSEANIYRQIGETIKSIPLSCLRDWSSRKDATRAAEAYGISELVESWVSCKNPKMLRFPYPFNGINVSRAFGDKSCSLNDKRAVTHKPKITVNRLLNGDTVVVACDGLKDFVPESKISEFVGEVESERLASTLVSSALNEYDSNDNISVVSLKIS
jgi:serine/threonine protein phosphatase PrpC